MKKNETPSTPTQENEKIRKLAIDRIIELEQELKSYGMRARFGMELEFFVKNEKGKPQKIPKDTLKSIKETLMQSRYVEDIKEENGQQSWTQPAAITGIGATMGITFGAVTGDYVAGAISSWACIAGALMHSTGMAANLGARRLTKAAQYEILIGDTQSGASRTTPTGKTYNRRHNLSALKAAIATEAMQSKLTDALTQTGEVTFTAKPRRDNLTSALHINMSLMDKDGNNIFISEHQPRTDLMQHTVKELVDIQREGALMFLPNENSHKRIHNGLSTPMGIGHYNNKTTPNFILRPQTTTSRHTGKSRIIADTLHGTHTKPEHTRIENRMPGADVDPYLTVLANLGAAVMAVRKERENTAETKVTSSELPKNLGQSLNTFNNSQLMRNILGNALHDAISEHYKKAAEMTDTHASAVSQSRRDSNHTQI